MLNSEIKRKIDNARDILVWKIPVPSQQIEQITIALIYKFMSDIDLQDKELWGEGFFQWEFEKYSWNNIMDRKIWGQERLNLYSEWLDKMETNPHLPQMFRDIFRNAYLPFKDPSTLDMFLKQIDEFSYDHSEDLGDAFEYLLSTAWSQWDAGQFRTPRHIIDFIVSIVQPQFTDTVLDPACGTAWFLISAYKYIMNQNKDKVAWDKLSLTQKKELTQHFVWYDISYEMVRLSLVNMYLHNFWDPKIFEYDTLSNDDRWDDRFDCILANPPFMTPKGWIQPHNRFSIKASKSEVLFVDYMIEHLNPHGKAWIVVPEGIIFQWANAYKDLRKKMIKENFLWAVVSLPAWVFQPYSWVKTSILLFDQELAKKTDKILFVKVQNDGFDLWAQRRPSNKNDLPKATEILLQYKKDLLAWTEINLSDSEMTLLVTKEKIEENSEFNLSVDRYKWWNNITISDFELVKLWDVCDKVDYRWKTPKKVDKGIFLVTAKNIRKWFIDYNKSQEYISPEDYEEVMHRWKPEIWDVLITTEAPCWNVAQVDRTDIALAQRVIKYRPKDKNLNSTYLKYVLLSDKFQEKLVNNSTGWVVWWIKWSTLHELTIPLPPLEVQEKIVTELDGYQKIIDWAKAIVESYKPTIKINPEWEMVKIGEICQIERWASPRPIDAYITEDTNWLNWVKIWDTKWVTKIINSTKEKITPEWAKKSRKVFVWDFILSNSMSFGRPYIMWTEWYVHDGRLILRNDDNKITKDFLYYILSSANTYNQFEQLATWWVVKNLNSDLVKQVNIPLPSLEEQNQIVAEIEKEEAMVESAKQLIEVFEKKIKDRIDEIRGK